MIVIARSYGQLGNRLFVYAHFIAAARAYGVPLANPCFAEYADFFPATAHDLWCRYPRPSVDSRPPSAGRRKMLAKGIYLTARLLSMAGLTRYPFQVLRIKGEQIYDLGSDEFANASRDDRHLLAMGWLFRSESLLRQHADAVRSHFQIAQPHRDRVDRLIASIRRGADVIVGVHIRHGDYATFMNGRYFYSVQQYAAAMQSIAQQLPGKRIAFLVCSNVKVERSDFGDLQVHFGPGHIIEDMYAMAEADLLVGPPSTYTGWASFYGNVPLLEMRTDEPIKVIATRPSPVSRVA